MAQIGLVKWRRASVTPSAIDQAREDQFLDEHITAGALIHQETAKALVAALHGLTDTNRRELLALRVFAEYVSALETMGAWGWAIRNRSEAPLLVDAFLSYSPSDVLGFYELAAAHSGELRELLNLPPTQEITDAFRKGGMPHAGLLSDFFKLERNLKTASEHYFHPQEIFLTTYNKAKHGAPILHDSKLDTGDFLLMAPERDAAQTDRYAFYKFSSSDTMMTRTLQLVSWVTHSTQGLVSFARNLRNAGLLY
jgi:hypothetical protein